jgi:hypothetical protein
MRDRRQNVLVGLELRVGEDLLSGRLVSAGEPDRAFAGWLDFLAAIHAAQRTGPAATQEAHATAAIDRTAREDRPGR